MEQRERREDGKGAADGADGAEGGWARGPQMERMERREDGKGAADGAEGRMGDRAVGWFFNMAARWESLTGTWPRKTGNPLFERPGLVQGVNRWERLGMETLGARRVRISRRVSS